MATKIQVRRGSSSNWTTTNPVLSEGEIGYETDSGKFKIGNGSSAWSALDYFLDSSDLSGYLTTSSASTTYLTQASASTNYLTKASASITYLTQESASANYLTQASASSTYAPIVPSTQTSFRNVLINGDFRINQRAFTSKGAAATVDYGFDRWFIYSSEGNATISPQTFALGNVISGHESSNFLRLTTPSTTKTNAFDLVGQRVEDVRTLAGQTATISFWAKAGSGTPSVSLELTQNFGTGGSPSADVNTYVNKITLSTSWTRYTMTISVPSISGKTIGTTVNTSYLELDIWGSAGSNFNARTNSLGNQNNTFDFWGIQMEKGSIATPFEQRPIGTELALCQRYYCRLTEPIGGNASMSLGLAGGTNFGTYGFNLPVPLRAVIPAGAGTDFNRLTIDNAGAGTKYPVTSLTYTSGTTSTIFVLLDAPTAGLTAGVVSVCRSASSGAGLPYIGFSAEL
jgi:hypothetical protein